MFNFLNFNNCDVTITNLIKQENYEINIVVLCINIDDIIDVHQHFDHSSIGNVSGMSMKNSVTKE